MSKHGNQESASPEAAGQAAAEQPTAEAGFHAALPPLTHADPLPLSWMRPPPAPAWPLPGLRAQAQAVDHTARPRLRPPASTRSPPSHSRAGLLDLRETGRLA